MLIVWYLYQPAVKGAFAKA